MKIWVSGFNAWGQLDIFDEKAQNQVFPDDLQTFQIFTQSDKLDILWTAITANMIEESGKILVAGCPDELVTILFQKPALCSSMAVAGNDKIVGRSIIDTLLKIYTLIVIAIENGALRTFDSLQNFRSGNGKLIENCQEFTHVVANQTSFTALSSTGEVWTWGDSRYSACLGREILCKSSASIPCLVESLSYLPTGPIKKISSGGYMTAALTEGNDLYVWGGHPGQPGILDSLASDPMPINIEGADIIDIAVGFDHILALTLERRLYTIGFGHHGQLGVNSKQQCQWKEVMLFPKKGQHIIKVYAGYKTSFVVTR
ncbi:putative serine threonine-protein kinase nek9 [Golovinomyces cichoracearum]|uniref:Putative serine threonine-protein kinase nek9 n=1 Tax=Golovinomyces cichoracearum TaxID=62708 RepID=A0A420IP93_9PEZI|nr:putative serine threonine-protein kinase nek9 [Golovinomyces cichoracearum]